MKVNVVNLALLSALLSSFLMLVGCGPIVRTVRNEIRQGDEPREAPRAKLPPVEDVAVSSEPLNWRGNEFDGFTDLTRGLLKSRDFDGLDLLAAKLRKNKERFRPGGGWIIHSFYLITGSAETASEDVWRATSESSRIGRQRSRHRSPLESLWLRLTSATPGIYGVPGTPMRCRPR